MNSSDAGTSPPTPQAVHAIGEAVLWAGGTFVTLILLVLAWRAPEAIPFIGVGLLGIPAVIFLFRRPLLNLSVLLALFVLVVGNEAGVQVTEALYGLYCMGFLAHWFVTRLLIYRDAVVRQPEDALMLGFLLVVIAWIPLTFVFGGEVKGLISEWTALVLLGFYFPVKEACLRYKHGTEIVLTLFIWIGVFVAVRNGFMYREALTDAEYAWQIITGRVWMNDTLLMVVGLVTGACAINVRDWRLRLLGGLAFMMMFIALVLTQSRTLWVAFAIGSLIIFLSIDRARKRQLIIIATGAVAVTAVIGLTFFSQYVDLVFLALVDRVASIGTAFSNDLSLINRFYESRAVFQKIAVNPVIGYGMAVPFRFHDLTHMGTVERTFIHNGYISLWYKFGILGLGLMLAFWGRSIWVGIQSIRQHPGLSASGMAAVGSTAALCAMLLSANTSNPFFLGDTLIAFTIVSALASAAREAGNRISEPVPASGRTPE